MAEYGFDLLRKTLPFVEKRLTEHTSCNVEFEKGRGLPFVRSIKLTIYPAKAPTSTLHLRGNEWGTMVNVVEYDGDTVEYAKETRDYGYFTVEDISVLREIVKVFLARE